MKCYTEGILSEMERLRKELYGTYGGLEPYNRSLNSQEIYKASTALDKLIVKFLREKYYTN